MIWAAWRAVVASLSAADPAAMIVLMSDVDDGRHETEVERLDRNWDELLQELRVVQTGVQLLAGFLITLPFQQQFTRIGTTDRRIYLFALGFAVLATTLLVAPVSAHRLLFRRHHKGSLVTIAHACARTGLVALAITVTLVVFLIFDVVVGRSPAWWAAGGALVVFVLVWGAVPVSVLVRDRR